MNKPQDWHQRAVGLLARREHSALELKQKLKQKGADEEEIDLIIAELKENGYQSDSRFVESYVRHRIEAGFGPIRIQQELKQRGISPHLIQKAIHQEPAFWFARLKNTWERRFHGKLPQNQQEYARQVRFLLQRGFFQDQVQKLISLT